MQRNAAIEMNAVTKKLIKDYANKPDLLNVVVVSAFIQNNALCIKDGVLADYYRAYDLPANLQSIKSIEDVITIFECAIPSEEKTANGAVYTPKYIRDYIIKHTVECHKKKTSGHLLIADISCGCGAFLYSAAEFLYQQDKNNNYSSIVNHLYGIDISPLSIERAMILLGLASAIHGEALPRESLHLICADALEADLRCFTDIRDNNGADLIVGNPPYVRAKHLSESAKESMKKWSVSKVGNPDLYIPFFEVGLSLLNSDGILGYITVNSFFKSVNARALRHYFHSNHNSISIINFGEEKIFKGVLAYTCLVFISKHSSSAISYCRASSSEIILNKDLDYCQIPYNELKPKEGWHLNTPEKLSILETIENAGVPLGKKYSIKNGLATLANSVYIFKPEKSDNEYFYHSQGNALYKIEKAICKDILKPNIIKSEDDISESMEKIIFPYKSDMSLFTEEFFQKKYPFAYKYLLDNKVELMKRDKGGAKDYPQWFAFGRTQAISDNGLRLVFPYMTDKPHFVYCDNPNILIYCGYSIFADSEKELLCLKKILESSVFDFYIRNTSKPYSTGYYSYAKNYIKSFGIPNLSPSQARRLSELTDKSEVDEYVESLYYVKK